MFANFACFSFPYRHGQHACSIPKTPRLLFVVFFLLGHITETNNCSCKSVDGNEIFESAIGIRLDACVLGLGGMNCVGRNFLVRGVVVPSLFYGYRRAGQYTPRNESEEKGKSGQHRRGKRASSSSSSSSFSSLRCCFVKKCVPHAFSHRQIRITIREQVLCVSSPSVHKNVTNRTAR